MVRLTPQELATVEAAASNAGLSVSSYSRLQMLGGGRPPPRSVRRPPIEKELLARLLGQVGKAGSNVNQIARSANMGDQDFFGTAETLQELREAAQAIQAALGRQK